VNVNDIVAARIEAARRQAEAAKRRRAELAAARKRGLAARHAARLRHQASVAQQATEQPENNPIKETP